MHSATGIMSEGVLIVPSGIETLVRPEAGQAEDVLIVPSGIETLKHQCQKCAVLKVLIVPSGIETKL